MTAVPLPDVPCVRIRLIGNQPGPGEWGNRLYFSYSGSAPTGANCITLAGDVANAWVTNLAPECSSSWALEEVDVLDIATNSGLSGQWTGVSNGSRAGTTLPSQCSVDVEFGIARRYRGGKPRTYLVPGNQGDTLNPGQWAAAYVTGMNTAYAAFIAAVAASSVGAMGTLHHVNLSYYHGFTNVTTGSGRERAIPTYRGTALHDNVTSYSTKAVIGSQKRRRTSTTP